MISATAARDGVDDTPIPLADLTSACPTAEVTAACRTAAAVVEVPTGSEARIGAVTVVAV